MPVSPKYPGVYIEEVPSGVRTIAGVSTATTAFVGRARKGPLNKPTVIHGFPEFERIFGELWADSTMSIAVNQYFDNGGGEAVIVRVFEGNVAANTVNWSITGIPAASTFVAANPGSWANTLVITVDHDALAGRLNISVRPGSATAPPLETIRNVSMNASSPFYIRTVLEQQSEYIRFGTGTSTDLTDGSYLAAAAVTDGTDLTPLSLVPASPNREGVYALDQADIFNLLCLPPPAPAVDVDATAYTKAAGYCGKRRAMLIVDPPRGATRPDLAVTLIPPLVGSDKKNAAAFYPRIKAQSPFNPSLIEEYVPSGAVAGVFARTDAQRGVWKAPAGTEATIAGALGLAYTMTDEQNGDLNPLGINALRTFPFIGQVVWGARTRDGRDADASEWKYIPVRRTALYIEESLFRGLKWVVFEPNDEPLWSQIRLNVGAFLNNMFRQGAFQGRSPREAYFVKCDRETTTQNDINLGIVNVLVGFAPLKPAEFVIIKIQQMAGQIAV